MNRSFCVCVCLCVCAHVTHYYSVLPNSLRVTMHGCAELLTKSALRFYDECKRRYNIKLWKQFCLSAAPEFIFMFVSFLCRAQGPFNTRNFESDLRRKSDRPERLNSDAVIISNHFQVACTIRRSDGERARPCRSWKLSGYLFVVG